MDATTFAGQDESYSRVAELDVVSKDWVPWIPGWAKSPFRRTSSVDADTNDRSIITSLRPIDIPKSFRTSGVNCWGLPYQDHKGRESLELVIGASVRGRPKRQSFERQDTREENSV